MAGQAKQNLPGGSPKYQFVFYIQESVHLDVVTL